MNGIPVLKYSVRLLQDVQKEKETSGASDNKAVLVAGIVLAMVVGAAIGAGIGYFCFTFFSPTFFNPQNNPQNNNVQVQIENVPPRITHSRIFRQPSVGSVDETTL